MARTKEGEVTPDPITITHEQLTTMLEVCKDIQSRIPANGMPELDQDLHEMIALLEEAASGGVVPPPGGEEIPLVRKVEDPVKTIVDPARPPEGKVVPEGASLGDLEAGKVKLEEQKKPEVQAPKHEEHKPIPKVHPVDPKEATLKQLHAEQDRREEYASHQKPKHK